MTGQTWAVQTCARNRQYSWRTPPRCPALVQRKMLPLNCLMRLQIAG